MLRSIILQKPNSQQDITNKNTNETTNNLSLDKTPITITSRNNTFKTLSISEFTTQILLNFQYWSEYMQVLPHWEHILIKKKRLSKPPAT